MKSQNDLDNLRHSCAHLLAAAVMELWPDTKRTIGPPIENGFYYDFDFGEIKISDSDLPKIEAKMKVLLPSWKEFQRQEVTPDKAKKAYKNNPYKTELINEFAREGQNLTFYKSGNYSDLCRGGHVLQPYKKLRFFKLLKIAGAYWRGDEKNKMLTRIYGTCWPTKTELDQYLWQQEEAKKRDHKKLGKELKLFTFHDMVGPGLPLWLPNGQIIRDEIEKLAKDTEKKWGYKRVSTPHLAKEELFKTSGHLPYYKDSMYPPMKLDDGNYYLKAMNCPHTHLIYKSEPRSYRDLPLRLAEYGTVYRHELSGTLSGLLRVRGMNMNDAHIYCTKEQIEEEFLSVMNMHKYYYELFGIKDYYMRLSLHDPKNKDKYIDKPENWKFTEEALKKAMKKSGLKYIESIGDAAFYGPKIDFQIKSVIGREETASTNQLDFAATSRFDLTYVDKNGNSSPLFVIHRAPLGTHERFIAFLIEHYAGKFPLWLSPIQLTIIPIAERHIDIAKEIANIVSEYNFRVHLDDRAETMQAKIRDAALQKIPYLGIIGDKEIEDKNNLSLSIRTRDNRNLGKLDLSQFLNTLKQEVETKI